MSGVLLAISVRPRLRGGSGRSASATFGVGKKKEKKNKKKQQKKIESSGAVFGEVAGHHSGRCCSFAEPSGIVIRFARRRHQVELVEDPRVRVNARRWLVAEEFVMRRNGGLGLRGEARSKTKRRERVVSHKKGEE